MLGVLLLQNPAVKWQEIPDVARLFSDLLL
jgi:hypothetical protein